MENAEKTLKELLTVWLKPAWSNKDIMMCFDVGMTQASKIHQDALLHKGHIRGLKTKVKSDIVCDRLGIDRRNQINQIMDIISSLKKNVEEEK